MSWVTAHHRRPGKREDGARLEDLSEHAIRRLLESPTVVRARIVWRDTGPRVRMRAPVDNEPGEALEVEMHVSRQIRWSYNIVLLWADRPIKRLDVRQSHRNVCDGSGRRWRWQTHKHAYSDRYEMAQAYDPRDIPPTPDHNLQPDEYRRVFEAFCQECGIRLDSSWVDPTFDPRQMSTMEDAS